MTILVAVKNKDRIILASDSLWTNDTRRFNNEKKIIKLDNFAIWFTGTLLFKQIFEYNLKDIKIWKTKLQNWYPKTTLDVYQLFLKLSDVFKEFWAISISKEFEDAFDMSSLIITKDKKIFSIDHMWFVTEENNYATAGSGNTIWLWAIEYSKFFDKERWETDLENIVEKTINICSRNMIACWWDNVYIHSFIDEQNQEWPIQWDNVEVQADEVAVEEVA